MAPELTVSSNVAALSMAWNPPARDRDRRGGTASALATTAASDMPGQRTQSARFETTALPHLDAVYRFARHLTGDEADAQDLSQECFHQAFRKFHQFRDGTNCRAWLFRIARNAHIDRIRRRARQPKTTELQDVTAGALDAEPKSLLGWNQCAVGVDDASIYERFGDEVSRTLRELPDEFRTAVLLCDVEEFSYQEIGEVLDCPVGTVRSRISRARALLKERLYDYARERGFAREGVGKVGEED